MRTVTTEFGVMEVTEESILKFVTPITGFEFVEEFILVDHDSSGIIMTLQPVEGRAPQFIVLDPFAFISDYKPQLTETDLELLKAPSSESLKYLTMTVVREDHMQTSINLKCPVAINPDNHFAAQVILQNDYSMKHLLFNEEGKI